MLSGVEESNTPLFFSSSTCLTSVSLNFPSVTTALIFLEYSYHNHWLLASILADWSCCSRYQLLNFETLGHVCWTDKVAC